MPETAIVILNWNGLIFLKQFLGQVVSLSGDTGTTVYIADNGSKDGSAEWVLGNFPKVKLIRLDRNYGFAGGYNLALGQISAKYYVLLNSDIEVTAGWLEPLLDYMEKNQDVASCQPKILSYNRRNLFEYAGAAGGFIDKMGYPLCRGRIFSKVEEDKGQYDNQIDIFWSTGACMVVRADSWEKAGGFDPDFFAHMEEIDLCWRFHKMGLRVAYIPCSKVYHVGGGALSYNSPYKTYLNFRNSLYFLYKNLPEKNFRRKILIRKILDGIAAVFFLCKFQFKSVRSVWLAHVDFYKNIGKLKEERLLVKKYGNKEPLSLILNKYLVFEFYIKQNKKYTSLTGNTRCK